MIKNNFSSSRLIISLYIISLIFALLKGAGFYGFGNDYYAIYHEHNLNFGSLFNRLGWIVSTLSYKENHLGVHLTTFILSLSYGLLLISIFKLKNISNIYYFIIIFLIGIHTWPIIMSTSNAMRQGLCMSMIFLSTACYLEKRIFFSFLFLFLSIFMHKSGPFVALIYIFSLFINRYSNKLNYFHNVFFLVFGIIIFFISFCLISYFEQGERGSRIIFKDYRYHFLILGLIYLLIFHYKDNFFKQNFMNVFVYYYVIATLPVLLLKLNYEYERLQMIMLIPMIFSVGMVFNKRSSYIFYLSSFLSLLCLTIYNGMYKSFS